MTGKQFALAYIAGLGTILEDTSYDQTSIAFISMNFETFAHAIIDDPWVRVDALEYMEQKERETIGGSPSLN